MGMDMNEWLIAWIKQCAQSAHLSGFNPHGNHGIAWSCSVEDYRALLWLVCIYGYSEHGATAGLGALNPDAQVIAFAWV